MCRYCETRWPAVPGYESCPQCREPTTRSQQPSLEPEAALHRRREAAFGWALLDSWMTNTPIRDG